MYRHALPVGFVLKKDKKKEEELAEQISLEELIETEVRGVCGCVRAQGWINAQSKYGCSQGRGTHLTGGGPISQKSKVSYLGRLVYFWAK